MATVVLHTKAETPDDHRVATVVTTDNFRSWKRKQGRDTAFVVQMSGANAESDDTSQLVCTFSDMQKLPTGSYHAQLVRKCAIPDAAKKQLRGTDLWKCV